MNSTVTDNRTPVTLIALDSPNSSTPSLLSPIGWINDGQSKTEGNNVIAGRQNGWWYQVTPLNGSSYRNFNFTLNLNVNAHDGSGSCNGNSTYAYNMNSAISSAFYLGNWAHDRFYQLGFDENWPNFQKKTFGPDRLENGVNDATVNRHLIINTRFQGIPLFDPNPCSLNQTSYIPEDPNPSAPKPSSIVMGKFDADSTSVGRHAGFDAEAMLHEYAHGVQDRLVTRSLKMQSLGMYEGFCDFFALSLLSDQADESLSQGSKTYAMGAYIGYKLPGIPASYDDNYYFGIRRFPYQSFLDVPSGQTAKNPLTYADIDPAQYSIPGGTPVTPLFTPNTLERHNIGELWASALWECRAELIAKHGWAGNEMMMEIAVTAIKLLGPCIDHNLVDARHAIIVADTLLHPVSVPAHGDNICELWAALASRGLGENVGYPGDHSTTSAGTVVEDFTIPSTGPCGPNAIPVGNWALYE